jgi:hypothetical protein
VFTSRDGQGVSVHEVRQMNPCHSYLPKCLNPRGPDVAIDRAAQLPRVWEMSRMGVTHATGHVILTDSLWFSAVPPVVW